MKPIIGIVSKNITVEEFYNWSWQRISNDIRYSINKNGGLVFGLLPQTLRKDFNRKDEPDNIEMPEDEIFDLTTLIKKCDGIILQGGISSHNYEEFIAKYCYQNDIPLLGICAGYNNIIRGLGGRAEKLSNVEVHDRPDKKYAHKCNVIDKQSLFYDIVKKTSFDVNSVHTYVGTTIPEELTVVAVSDDNQIEVVEAKNKKFFIGIKYHPELLVDDDLIQNKIFKRFVECCTNKNN